MTLIYSRECRHKSKMSNKTIKLTKQLKVTSQITSFESHLNSYSDDPYPIRHRALKTRNNTNNFQNHFKASCRISLTELSVMDAKIIPLDPTVTTSFKNILSLAEKAINDHKEITNIFILREEDNDYHLYKNRSEFIKWVSEEFKVHSAKRLTHEKHADGIYESSGETINRFTEPFDDVFPTTIGDFFSKRENFGGLDDTPRQTINENEFWDTLMTHDFPTAYYVIRYTLKSPEGIKMIQTFNMDGNPSILRYLTKRHPGVTSAMVFMGNAGSGTGFHNEDLQMPSINYLMAGGDKIWITINSESTETFKALLESIKINYGIDPNCNLLVHKNILISPELLNKKHISFSITRQMAGDFVVTAPGAIHMVFNTALNIAAACNFSFESCINSMTEAYIEGPPCHFDNRINLLQIIKGIIDDLTVRKKKTEDTQLQEEIQSRITPLKICWDRVDSRKKTSYYMRKRFDEITASENSSIHSTPEQQVSSSISITEDSQPETPKRAEQTHHRKLRRNAIRRKLFADPKPQNENSPKGTGETSQRTVEVLKETIKKNYPGMFKGRRDRTPEYKCPVCQAASVRKRDFNRHYATKHSGWSFKCKAEGCEFKCNRIDNLQKHVRNHGSVMSEKDIADLQKVYLQNLKNAPSPIMMKNLRRCRK